MTRRALVVDDEEAIREIAALRPKALGGHEVLTAGSGVEALDCPAAEPWDAVVLDAMTLADQGAAILGRGASSE